MGKIADQRTDGHLRREAIQMVGDLLMMIDILAPGVARDRALLALQAWEQRARELHPVADDEPEA